MSVSSPNIFIPATLVVEVLMVLLAKSHDSVVISPSPVLLIPSPQPYSAPIEILGRMKYSAPMKPRSPKPKVEPATLSLVLLEVGPEVIGLQVRVDVADVLVVENAFP